MSQPWPYSARLIGNTRQTAAGRPFLNVAVKGRYHTLQLASTGKERRVQRDEIAATEALWEHATPTPSNDAIRKSKVSKTNAPDLVPFVRESRRIADLAETALEQIPSPMEWSV
jgi:hypothetical protein